MYPTYEYIKKVSEDTTLTPSQKMHEVFKNSKTEPLQMWIDKLDVFQNEDLTPTQFDPSLKIDQAEVVAVEADGQIIVFRYPDNSYHYVDAGGYVEIEGVDYIAVGSIDENIGGWFEDLLITGLMTSYPLDRGFWVDEDLQKAFEDSYPER